MLKKCLYSKVLKIGSRIKDISEILIIIDNLNKSNILTSNCRLVSFYIINMFPSIDNISGLKVAISILDAGKDQFPPTACTIEALKLCLECKNSSFNNKDLLQMTAQHKVLVQGVMFLEQYRHLIF